METPSGPHSSRISSQPFPFSLILPAEGHWQNEQVTSLSPMLLADQLDSSTVTLVCVDVLYVLYQLSWDIHRHWLFHLKIFAMRGFWVSCLISRIYSQLFVFALLRHVGGNLLHFPVPGNGINAHPELNLLVCSTLHQASGVKQVSVTAPFGSLVSHKAHIYTWPGEWLG